MSSIPSLTFSLQLYLHLDYLLSVSGISTTTSETTVRHPPETLFAPYYQYLGQEPFFSILLHHHHFHCHSSLHLRRHLNPSHLCLRLLCHHLPLPNLHLKSGRKPVAYVEELDTMPGATAGRVLKSSCFYNQLFSKLQGFSQNQALELILFQSRQNTKVLHLSWLTSAIFTAGLANL